MTRRARLLAALLVLACAGWLATRLAGERAPSAQAPKFEGTRSRLKGATFTETDDATGRVLRIRGEEAVTRDGKVGIVFRTPLRATTELTGVEVDLLDRGGAVILDAKAQTGTFDAAKKGLVLRDPVVRVGGLRLKAARLLLRSDGAVAIQGDYEIYRGETLLGRGRDYAGTAVALVERARGAAAR